MTDFSAPSPDDTSALPGVLLHSLDGKAGPTDLGQALAKIDDVPATLDLVSLVQECIEPLADDQLDNRILRHCRKLDVDPKLVGPAVKATRFLLRSAAANNVGEPDLRSDMDALVPGSARAADVVAAAYLACVADLRREILTAALLGHGRVLQGLDWRIDTIGSCSAGRSLNVPVAMLTMHYRDASKNAAFTIQLLPEMVSKLRDLCDELLSR